MSYNILNKNVNFQGSTQGTIEDVVDTHTAQSITGSKDFLTLTGSHVHVKNGLGIGTTFPQSKLDVEGGVSIGSTYSGTTAAPSDGIIVEGKAGIGTNNPSGKLEVVSGNDSDGTIAVRSGNATQYSKISMGTNVNKATIGMAGSADTFFTDTAQGDLVLRADDNNNKVHIGAGTSGIAGMVVTEVSNVGRVGIGVASPDHPLHVVGTISGSGAISGSAFFGDGTGLSGVATTLASNGGLTNPSSVSVSPNDATELTTANDDDFILVSDSQASHVLKKIKASRVAGLFNAAVTTYGGNNAGRILVANGAGDIQGNASLTISAAPKLTLNGAMDISGELSGSGVISGSIGHFVTRVESAAIGLSDASGIAGDGLVNNSGFLDVQVSGAIKIASDKLGITGSFAGNGLAFAGGADSISGVSVNIQSNSGLAVDATGLKLSANTLGTATPAASADSLLFIDADDSVSKKMTFNEMTTAIRGSGLDASSGVLSVDVSDFMAAGANNRVLTATGTGAMTGEENLTFDGSLLTIAGTGSATLLRANYTGGGHTDALFLVSGSNTDIQIQNMQQGNAGPSFFLAGENHASFPGVLYNANKLTNLGAITQGNHPGANGSHSRLTVRKTSISDNTATDIITITVPNANHAAAIRVFGLANFDGCAYSQVFSFQGTIGRTSGAPTDKAFSSVTTTENASVTPNFSIAVGGSANTGGNSASQTFKMQLTINTSDSASSNATIMIELINFNDSGVTMVAS